MLFFRGIFSALKKIILMIQLIWARLIHCLIPFYEESQGFEDISWQFLYLKKLSY